MKSRLSWVPRDIIDSFWLPLFVFICILLASLALYVFAVPAIGMAILFVAVGVGGFDFVRGTVQSVLAGKFVLDYIAILAITVALLTGHYLVAALIVLMLTGGTTLERYGMAKARKSLSALIARIPTEVNIWESDHIVKKIPIGETALHTHIAIRRGEVFPLDGTLISETASTDESSLTGEPYYVDKVHGDVVRSGTINVGDLAIVSVTKLSNESTYAKIVEMVRAAQEHKAPLIRLADRYSGIFTLITLAIAVVAYVASYDMTRVLAVLVIATPCPLILATPIALIGGINAAARKRTIIKDIASLEVMSRIGAIVFDKTGTITLGKPVVTNIVIRDTTMSEANVFGIADALERNSLHPLAKAMVEEAKKRHAPKVFATKIAESVGNGIMGTIGGKKYSMIKAASPSGMAIALTRNNREIAVIQFSDRIRPNAVPIMKSLVAAGLKLYLFTGDKKAAADSIVSSLGVPISVQADMSPEEKMEGILSLKQQKVTAMVGDGINDAPALAAAHVGMVFAHEEYTAASEAADVVFVGGDVSSVASVLALSKRTIRIAIESIIVGIGLSTLGMIAAAAGFIPPALGAALQEGIDLLVIFNALRTSYDVPTSRA